MKDTTAYKNSFRKEVYDQINLVLPKGYKETLKAEAASKGTSVNSLIKSLIDEAIKV